MVGSSLSFSEALTGRGSRHVCPRRSSASAKCFAARLRSAADDVGTALPTQARRRSPSYGRKTAPAAASCRRRPGTTRFRAFRRRALAVAPFGSLDGRTAMSGPFGADDPDKTVPQRVWTVEASVGCQPGQRRPLFPALRLLVSSSRATICWIEVQSPAAPRSGPAGPLECGLYRGAEELTVSSRADHPESDGDAELFIDQLL